MGLLLLAALLLCGCGGQAEVIDNVVPTSQVIEIRPDPSGRMNGRGAYICRNADCIDQAVKRHGFERAFKMSVSAEAAARLREEVLQIHEAE
jgi:predicted RNA-binding protein YlxR (DUF448 family)